MPDQPKLGRPVELRDARRADVVLDEPTRAHLERVRVREGLRSRSEAVRWVVADDARRSDDLAVD